MSDFALPHRFPHGLFAWVLVIGTVLGAPPSGPALDPALFRPLPEPPGPSSRRAGVVVSEVMYHPAHRTDAADGQFVEVFNSLPYFEDLSGWQLQGDIGFTFPPNFILPSRGYVVVAANPGDFTQVTGQTNALGPFTGTLPKGAGQLRLMNRLGAVQFEMAYRDDGAWPAAADGGGPSLVLAKPSFGERDPRAWAASEAIGGSPGTAEPPPVLSARTVVINELLAHTAPPAEDFIELYNYSNDPSDLSGCVLTDDPAIDKYVFPTNTVVGALGWVSRTRTELGFGLASGGEVLFLKSADGKRVLDAVRYGPQERDVAFGRTPDGALQFSRLAEPTPGSANSGPKVATVVLNEIMYHPPSEDSADEYVELHNPGTVPVDLGGWRLEDAVGFTFPDGRVLAAGGYLVVGKAAARLQSHYPNLNPGNLVGDFTGTLSHNGDHLALSRPDPVLSTNKSGHVVTNLIHVVVDEVTYGNGGRWGRWSDGGGSSLELRDPRADRRWAANWADSDETAKSGWVTVEATDKALMGGQTATSLEMFLYGPGECLVDNVEVIGPAGTNVVANSTFESGITGWVFQGNHNATSIETGEGFQSAQSLHIRATGAGHTGPNRVRVPLTKSVTSGQTATLRARVRWLKGAGNLMLRLHGNWIEAPGYSLATSRLGTPGARNSIAVTNAGPAISDVSHWPVLPSPTQDVVVTARVDDPDGLSTVVLRWRKDPGTVYTEVTMSHRGAGIYAGAIPGQPASSLVAFQVVATDAATVPAAASFPAEAPVHECLVRWGESYVNGALGSYKMWMTKTNVSRWTSREKLSNDPLDLTLVYGNSRVIYNAGGQYSGSPYHAPGWTGPGGAICDYVVVVPADDALLGNEEMNLLVPGNGGGDGTCQAEQQAYWIADQLGLPHCHRRPILVYFNGTKRGIVMEDAQQPNSDFVRQWFPDDSGGELRKIQIWFEFDNSGTVFDGVGADLSNYAVGGVKRRARYRWNWPLRSFGNDPNNFTNLFRLVDAVNTPVSGDTYTRTLLNATDVDEWFRVHVTEHLVGNNDSYSYGGGQNMYTYKPVHGPWRLMIWDIDFAFNAQGPQSDLFGIGGQNVGPVNTHAPFSRLYYQALIDALNGPLQADHYTPILDARYNGMRTNGGTGVSTPTAIKAYMAARRTYVNSLLTNKVYGFSFTGTAGGNLTSAGNYVTLTGTSPLTVRTVLLNGQPLDVRWTTLSNWTATVALSGGVNALELSGLDPRGQAVTNPPAHLSVTVTTTPEPPEGRIVFNEVMHHPSVPGAAFIELRNLSLATAFDLSGWRVDGAGVTFAPGTFLAPGAYGLVVEDPAAFAQVYGALLKPLGVFGGRLNPAGETLRLIRPGPTLAGGIVVDQFTFETDEPWPAAALDGGSLQLVDLGQENNRPANWTAVPVGGIDPGSPWQRIAVTGNSSGTGVQIFLGGAGEAYIDDVRLVPGNNPDSGATVIRNGGFETDLAGTWTLAPNLAGSVISTSVSHGGYGGLRVVSTAAGNGAGAAIVQGLVNPLQAGTPYTLSFWYLPNPAGGVLTVRTSDGGIQVAVGLASNPVSNLARATPGAPNSVAASLAPFPAVWLNELQTDNLSGPVDNSGQRGAWVELYNSGPTPASLAGCYLTDSFQSARRWPFPAGTILPAGGFLLVWLDGRADQTVAGQPHASFRPAVPAGVLALTRTADGRTNVLDYLRYVAPGPDRTLGTYPDGNRSDRRLFALATPRAANSLAAPLLPVFINEWMAANTATLQDPGDGGYNDWFELYNAGPTPANLAGYYLANSLTNRTQFAIPAGYLIPAGGRMLVWADKKPSLNLPSNPDLHVGFKLSADGESIVLAAPDGTIVDAVTFGTQSPDVSEGRVPDGGVVAGALPRATPGTVNEVPPPEFLGVVAGPDSFTVSWTTFPGLHYQLEATATLDFPAWGVVGDPYTAQSPAITVQRPVGDRLEQYFRVRLVP